MAAGPATYSRDADVASVARAQLDRVAAQAAFAEQAQRDLLAELIELWSTSAWLAAGVTSAKQWLLAYTDLSYPEAKRLEDIAGLCAAHPALADAVVSGALSLGRADRLARVVTAEREPFLAEILPKLLQLATRTSDDETFMDAVRYWTDRVDEQLAPRRVQPQSLTTARSLFGGGTIVGQLAPVTFETVCAAIDAWTQDPDPADAPYQRTLSERRADALDDLCADTLARSAADDVSAQDPDEEAARAEDTFDGSSPGDDLDEALAHLDELDPSGAEPRHGAPAGSTHETHDEAAGIDPMVLLRRRLQRAEQHRRRRVRRRTRARSIAQINVHTDIRTLLDLRDGDDLDDLVLRGEGWSLTRRALEQHRCDASFVVTLFDGKTKVLDANTAAERFTRAQRRALAARDGHCVFPSCTREPRHCDAHHLHHREDGGPSAVANGALLCRFHHRLLHQHGWELLVDHTGHWTATDPHGTTWTGRPAQREPGDCEAAVRPPEKPSHQEAT